MAAAPQSLSERTDACLDFIDKQLSDWYRDVNTARPQDLKIIGHKLGLESANPEDIKSAMLNQVLEVATSCVWSESSKPAGMKLDRRHPVIGQEAGTLHALLDFRLSHSKDTSAIFEMQLTEFLLTASNRRLKTNAAELNKTVSNQVTALILALKRGTLVHSVSDIEKYFTQDYIINAFMASEDLIVWDGETEELNIKQQDWKFRWSKRRVWVMKQVFLFHGQPGPLSVETNEHDVLPTLYARINIDGYISRTGWQSTSYAPSGKVDTNANAVFPNWITDQSFLGASGKVVHLRQFLHGSQVFERGQHLRAQNIVYYFVVRNSDYETIEGCQQGGTVSPSPLQIYIGKAANGVIRRWVSDQWAHCRAARDLLNARKDCRDFTDFVAAGKPAKLVDCCLAMAHLRAFQTALFIVQECSEKDSMENMEAELIRSHDATNMQHGLNCKEERKIAKTPIKAASVKVILPARQLVKPLALAARENVRVLRTAET